MPSAPADPRALARRIEDALAEQVERTGPGSAILAAGGRAVMKGPRSPFSAALGAGLEGPVSAMDLDRIELHLGVAGGPVRVEVTPFADASLAEALGRRGYALERLLQVWWRPPLPLPEAPPFPVREVLPAEHGAWVELFAQAFLGGPTQSEVQRAALLAMPRAEGVAAFLAQAGAEAAGVALASAWRGVALLTAAGVVPALRGRGVQRALVRARLAWAAARGCDVAASATEAGTASARVLLACGFLPAYPKAVMVRGG